MNLPKATRPLEYVCLFQADLPTKEDGDVYNYLAVDVYSGKLFFTGAEKNSHDSTILKHTQLLLNLPEFKKGLEQHKSFTLVFHKYNHLLNDLNSMVAPVNGSVIINDSYVAKVFEPVLHKLFEHLSKNL